MELTFAGRTITQVKNLHVLSSNAAITLDGTKLKLNPTVGQMDLVIFNWPQRTNKKNQLWLRNLDFVIAGTNKFFVGYATMGSGGLYGQGIGLQLNGANIKIGESELIVNFASQSIITTEQATVTSGIDVYYEQITKLELTDIATARQLYFYDYIEVDGAYVIDNVETMAEFFCKPDYVWPVMAVQQGGNDTDYIKFRVLEILSGSQDLYIRSRI